MMNHILERLEAGAVSRQLDEDIFLLFNPEPSGDGWRRTSVGNWHQWPNDPVKWTDHVHAPTISTSVEKTIELIEKERPDWLHGYKKKSDGSYLAHVENGQPRFIGPKTRVNPDCLKYEATSTTISVALLLAFLKSLPNIDH